MLQLCIRENSTVAKHQIRTLRLFWEDHRLALLNLLSERFEAFSSEDDPRCSALAAIFLTPVARIAALGR